MSLARRTVAVIVVLGPLTLAAWASLAATSDGGASATCMQRRATLAGNGEDETLRGTPHRDVIAAHGGDDVVAGRGGDDLICGGRGADRLHGTSGNDEIHGQRGGDTLGGGKGRQDRCYGGRNSDLYHRTCEVHRSALPSSITRP